MSMHCTAQHSHTCERNQTNKQTSINYYDFFEYVALYVYINRTNAKYFVKSAQTGP